MRRAAPGRSAHPSCGRGGGAESGGRGTVIGRWRRWWAARSLRARMAVVVGAAAAVVLVLLGRLAVGVLASALVGAADAELQRHAEVAAVQLSSGVAAETLAGPSLRVVDTAGQPV